MKHVHTRRARVLPGAVEHGRLQLAVDALAVVTCRGQRASPRKQILEDGRATRCFYFSNDPEPSGPPSLVEMAWSVSTRLR